MAASLSVGRGGTTDSTRHKLAPQVNASARQRQARRIGARSCDRTKAPRRAQLRPHEGASSAEGAAPSAVAAERKRTAYSCNDLTSRNSSKPYSPSSRPLPLCL